MAEAALLLTGNNRLRRFPRSISWPSWFLAMGCFWTAVQSFAAWCKGARIAPLGLFDELAGSDLPMLAFLVLVPLMVWQFFQVRESLLRGNWSICKPVIGRSVVLLIALAAFTAVYVEEEWFSPGFWTRMGERHLLERIGGAAKIAGDSAHLIEKVRTKVIPAAKDVVPVEQLVDFSALSAWKFERCDVDVEMPRLIYMIDRHNGITVDWRDGKWRVQRERFGGQIYWSEIQP